MVKSKTSLRKRSKKVDTCKQATSLIIDYLTDEMDSATRRAFEEHLTICPDCISFLNTYKKTVELAKSFLESSPLKIKKKLNNSLENRLKLKLLRAITQ